MVLLLSQDETLKQAKECLARCSSTLPTLRADVEQAYLLSLFMLLQLGQPPCLFVPLDQTKLNQTKLDQTGALPFPPPLRALLVARCSRAESVV